MRIDYAAVTDAVISLISGSAPRGELGKALPQRRCSRLELSSLRKQKSEPEPRGCSHVAVDDCRIDRARDIGRRTAHFKKSKARPRCSIPSFDIHRRMSMHHQDDFRHLCIECFVNGRTIWPRYSTASFFFYSPRQLYSAVEVNS